MVCIGKALQMSVLAVDRAGVLGEVVGAQGEEVYFFRELIRDKDGGGCLDHDSDLIISDLDAFVDQLLLALLEDSLGFDQLPLADDHGEHDAQVAVSGGAEQSAQLGLEEVLPGQADTDRAETEGGVLFLVQVHVVDRLVRTDVAGTDDDEPGGESFEDALIGHELLLLSGLFLTVEIDKFGAEQADAFRIVLIDTGNVFRAADVGINVDIAAVDGGAGLALELLKQSVLLEVRFVFDLELIQQLRSRINVDAVGIAVKDGHLAVPAVIDILALDQGRQVHRAGQDRGVAVGGALAGDHAQKEGLVELDGLRGSQIFRDKDGRLCTLQAAGVIAQKEIKDSGLYVNDIRASGLHVSVIHLREHLCIHIKSGLGRVLGSAVLLCDDLAGGILQVLILKHELMSLENRRGLFARVCDSLLIQFTLLVDGLLEGIFKAGQLSSGIFHDRVADLIAGGLVDLDLADTDTF